MMESKSEVLAVKSSWIDGFMYEPSESSGGLLVLRTLTGSEYEFVGVPRYLWELLKGEVEDGGSVGAFYNCYLRGQYAPPEE
jgi:hypothetical protein